MSGLEESDAEAYGRHQLSHDGSYLAIETTTDSNSSVIGVIPAAGGDVRWVLEMSESETWPAVKDWTPDRRFIVYFVHGDGENWLWRVSLDGGDPLRTELQHPGAYELRISPDGRHFAMQTNANSGSIWVLENFLPS